MALNPFRRKTLADPQGEAKVVDPRKVDSGTSYVAEGLIPVPSEALNEKGSSKANPLQQGVPELSTNLARQRAYAQMVDDDASTDLALKATKTPVLGADYYVEPYSDQEIDIEIAEFVQYNLFEGLNTPFLTVLEEALRMCDFGHSVVETVYETREWAPKRKQANRRQFTMLRKLAPRPASTIKEFLYDDAGGPAGVKHGKIAADGKVTEVTIPIEKLIIFTFGKKGGDLEGRSVLRPAYKHWWYKNVLYRIDGIQKERHGTGVPEVQLPPGYTKADSDAAWELVRNVRTNERAGFVKPPGWEVGFAKMEGQPVDVLDSIDHHDSHILLSVMAQFLILGLQKSGGGRATSASHMDMFHKSMRYLGALVCDYFNLYLIPRLVAYNYQTRNYPKLQVRNIGESKDLQMWASAVANLIARNAITVDYDFEQWVRQVVDAPKKVGGKQTPENNPGSGGFGNEGNNNNKGDVDTEQDKSGNIGKGTDEG